MNTDVEIDLKQCKLDGSQFIQILCLPSGYHAEFGILVFHLSPPNPCRAVQTSGMLHG